MDKNEPESKSSFSIEFDFKEESQKKFPHDIGFPKDISKHSNNYFNATFHCLSNICDLVSSVIDAKNKDGSDNPFIYLLNKIVVGNNKQEEKEIMRSCIGSIKNYIFPDPKCEEECNNDPRKLIPLFMRDLENNEILPEEILIKFEKICSICKTVTQLDEYLDVININNKYIKFDIPEILKYTHEKKIEEFTIYDCFEYYFDSFMKIEKNLDCSQCHKETIHTMRINKLPDILFIFLYYDEQDKNCHFENSAYKFEENINFERFKFICEDDRKKKYVLTSMIACKNVGTDFELFYTFSRINNEENDENNRNYIIYNGSDIRKGLSIRNKMKKDKIDFRNKKQSWPYVLVYKNIGDN